ncbi:HNH endonuclease [Pectobacterium phage vB_PatM_CB7]|nr:HNH endonuclease [Pectobacterium phage vB_PatM_CB7]
MKKLRHPCGYFITETGNFYSSLGKLLKPSVSKSTGYIMYSKGSAHRLIWETFKGPIPEGMVINHKNGIKTDIRLDNLEVTTPSENTLHAYQNGLAKGKSGEENSQAKLTNQDFDEICEKLMSGYSNYDISVEYGIHERYVSLIRHKRRWKSKFPDWYVVVESPINLPTDVRTIQQVIDLCFLTKISNAEIADWYGLNRSTVSRIRGRKTWTTFLDIYYKDCNDHRNHAEMRKGVE